MKKILKMFVVCFLIAGCFAYQSNAATIDQLQITTVDDIDGAEALTANNIVIADKDTQEIIWSFTISKAGTVDIAYVNGDKLRHDFTLYRDMSCVTSVGTAKYQTTILVSAADTKKVRYSLEQGTYYLKMTKQEASYIKDIDNAPVKIYVAYENANSDEVYLPSSFDKANPLKVNEVFRGFITREQPSDYYTFTLTKGAKVSLDWFIPSNSNGADWAEMYVYNQDKKEVGKQSNYNSGSLINVLYLEAGKYYVELRVEEKLQSHRNGKTSIKMTTEPLPSITLTPSTTKPTNKNVKYTIKQNLSPSESVELAVSATNYGDNNTSWDYKTMLARPTNNKFTITQNGTYYLRAKYKADGKVIYTKITTFKVSNIDKVAPKVATVNEVKAKSVKVTGKGEKKASVIVTIGSKTYQGTVSASGTFSVKIPAAKKGQKISVKLKDAAGNISSAKTVTVR